MITIDNPVKNNQDQMKNHPPAQYALVLHMNTAGTFLTAASALHVIRDHLGLNNTESIKVVAEALRIGKAVVKPVTKDVGETLLADLNNCSIVALSNDFKISLEQI